MVEEGGAGERWWGRRTDYARDAVEGSFAFLLDGAGAGAGRAVEDFGVDCEALLGFWGEDGG